MSNTAEESDSIPCVGIHVTQYLENSRARPWRKTHGRDSLPHFYLIRPVGTQVPASASV